MKKLLDEYVDVCSNKKLLDMAKEKLEKKLLNYEIELSVRADIINSILLYLYDCNENECESTSEVIATIISIMQNGFLKRASKGFLEKIEMKKRGVKMNEIN